MALFARTRLLDGVFETPTRYSAIKPLGTDVSGLLCSARDQIGQKSVALKKLHEPFASADSANNVFREIRLLKSLKHENVINLVDIFISPSEDIYLVMELMKTNLQVLSNVRPIEGEFVQYLLYQILRGLKYLHSAGVVHCDLKPGNILVDQNCDLKICDLGLARAQELSTTDYVATKWYRAPEILLTWQAYDEKVDIWSAGCILAELLRGKPLFPGQNYIHQFHVITELLGTPAEDVISKMTTPNTLQFVQSLPNSQGKPLSSIIQDVDPSAINLLEKLLVFDPQRRLTASEALTYPYLAPYHDPTDEPEAERRVDWRSNEADYSVNDCKAKIYAEIKDYHKEENLQASVRRWLRGTNDYTIATGS